MHGLEEQFDTDIVFVWLNAADGAAGQAAYEQLTLPGHPSIVIFDATEEEAYRGFGSFDEETLAAEIRAILEE